MAESASPLLTLIDAYAAARSSRDAAFFEFAAWAFADENRRTLAARTAVADALGIADPPPLRDPITAAVLEREAEDAALSASIVETASVAPAAPRASSQAGLASIRAGIGLEVAP